MGLNVLEWFAQESLKFDLFLDTKTFDSTGKAQIDNYSSEVLLTP